MAHDPVPRSLKPGILIQKDLHAEVQLAVPTGVGLIADLGHLGNALVHREPQGVLIQGAILARAQRHDDELLVAKHGGQACDGLRQFGLAVDADFIGHGTPQSASSS
ncbi:hypothetical protein D3C85_1371420 [compost metagenome]